MSATKEHYHNKIEEGMRPTGTLEHNPKAIATLTAMQQLLNVTLDDIKAPTRVRSKVMIRQQFAVINNRMERTEAARLLGLVNSKGKPDHASICHYLKKHEGDYKYSEDYRRQFDEINSLVTTLLQEGGTKRMQVPCFPDGSAYLEIPIHGAKEAMKLIHPDARVLMVEIKNPFICIFSNDKYNSKNRTFNIESRIDVDSEYLCINKEGFYFAGYREGKYFHTDNVNWSEIFIN